MAIVWAVLATPETALAKKPGGLHGSATFRDSSGDAVQSDGLGPYYDSVDFTELGLGNFFSLTVKTKRDAGRELNLNFPAGIDPDFFPATQNIWILCIPNSGTQFRELVNGSSSDMTGYLMIGQTGKDEAGISYGQWGPDGDGEKGDPLTVTRTGDNTWTIESKDTDLARFYRQTGKGWMWYELAPMPFKITYNGTATPLP